MVEEIGSVEAREIYQKTVELLETIADRLPSQDAASCREDLSAGEVGLAINTVTGALLEDEIEVSRHEYELLHQLLHAYGKSVSIPAVQRRDEILSSLKVQGRTGERSGGSS